MNSAISRTLERDAKSRREDRGLEVVVGDVQLVLQEDGGAIFQMPDAALRRDLQPSGVQPGVERDQAEVAREVLRRSRITRLIEEHAALILEAVAERGENGCAEPVREPERERVRVELPAVVI